MDALSTCRIDLWKKVAVRRAVCIKEVKLEIFAGQLKADKCNRQQLGGRRKLGRTVAKTTTTAAKKNASVVCRIGPAQNIQKSNCSKHSPDCRGRIAN